MGFALIFPSFPSDSQILMSFCLFFAFCSLWHFHVSVLWFIHSTYKLFYNYIFYRLLLNQRKQSSEKSLFIPTLSSQDVILEAIYSQPASSFAHELLQIRTEKLFIKTGTGARAINATNWEIIGWQDEIAVSFIIKYSSFDSLEHQ